MTNELWNQSKFLALQLTGLQLTTTNKKSIQVPIIQNLLTKLRRIKDEEKEVIPIQRNQQNVQLNIKI